MTDLVDRLVEMARARLQKLHHPTLEKAGVHVDVLRLDLIHPIISGNKYFKLKYTLKAAVDKGYRGIVTMGGPWSNHLVACAEACRLLGLQSIGIIRGERPVNKSLSLDDLEQMGMELRFMSRAQFAAVNASPNELSDHLFIPMGGYFNDGIRGASEIIDLIPTHQYEFITCAVGTSATMTGLLKSSPLPVYGFSALKISDPDNNELKLSLDKAGSADYKLFYDYHFGGFGKAPVTLTTFMRDFYEHTQIPTDIVYTSKMFYGLLDLVNKKVIAPGTRICAIHSGGLQGNRSVKTGLLPF